MAVTFVIGRAGSGKTKRCFDAIVDALRASPLGPPIYWLVPPQATFTAERELTCLSRLCAFCRARVVSFEQFGRNVFDECGGSSIPQVTPLGRQMVLGHLLRQNRPRLRFFSKSAHQPGLAAELDATLSELERSGKGSAELAQLIAELSESNAADLELAPLLEKLHDVRLLYDAYVAYLGQDRLDQHRRLQQVQASLSECAFLRQSTIFVDGFLDFTESERRILVGAARAGATVQVTFLIDPDSPTVRDPHHLPDEMGLFHRTEEAYRKLYFALNEEGVHITEPVRLVEPTRFEAPALRELERSLFRDPIRPSTRSDAIELIEAPDRASEVDAVARQVRSLLMQGLRLRDICVLMRDLAQYHRIIDASFREHGIPYFVDRRRPAGHHPLVQFVRSLFQIARNDWPHDAAMAILRSGLAGLSLYDADGLENYVLQHRIHGVAGWESAKNWGFRRKTVGPEEKEPTAATEPSHADALRRQVLHKLRPLLDLLRSDDPRQIRAIASEIFATLERFNVRQTHAQWIESARQALDLEQAAEHEQVWLNLVDLFDQMVDLLGDERMTAGEFFDVLESGLERFDLAITPPTVDQVLVGQADRTRTPRLRAAFVLGMNEGEFPRVPRDGSVLNDADRRGLRRRRIDLETGLHQRLLDERLLAYMAFTRPSHRLFVSRSLTDDDGRSAEPSVFWQRLNQLFPDARRTTIAPVHSPDPSRVATARQLVTGLMRWVRQPPDPVPVSNDPTWSALYQWFARGPSNGSTIDEVRKRAWKALTYANSAALAPEVARELFASPLKASVSQVETFAACPFKHFVRFGLGLRDRECQTVTVQDLGRVCHDVLENALRDVMRRRLEGDATAKLETAIEHFVTEAGGRLRDELMLSTARNRYLLDRVRRTLELAAVAQREILRRGRFRPAHVGVTFGQGGPLPALRLSTPGGGEILLHGKMDRIDRVEGSEDVAVIDYRLSASQLPIGMVLHGLSLQLLTHLLVLESEGKRLAGRNLDPAAAFYLQLLRKIEPVAHPDEAANPTDPKWHLKLKPRGVFDRRCLAALDRELDNGSSAVVQAFVKQDGTLGHRNTSDAAESQEFRALLRVVAQKLSELGDGILSGKIDIAPYRLNESPCPRCEYHGVCRFDAAINRYNHLQSRSREEILHGKELNE